MSRRAVPGSNERPDGEFAFDTERPVDGPIQPGVYIVTQRPSSLSIKLLPPLFLIALGAGFLVYREAAADWRGISALADWFEPAKHAPVVAQAPVPDKPAPPAVALNTEPSKPATPPALEPPKVEHVPSNEPGADPLADIQREADKEKARIAELEKLKAREEEKLAATEDQRHAEQRQEQLKRHGMTRQQLAQALAMQREFMRRNEEMFDQMAQQQFQAMQDMQKRFLGRGFPDLKRLPMPGPDLGFGMIPPIPEMEGKDGEEVVKKTPDGGVTRFRRFSGPGGMTGFRLEIRSGDANNLVPPPPKPGLRDDDEKDVPPIEPAPDAPRARRID